MRRTETAVASTRTVFHDPSGRRWLRLRILLITLLGVAALGVLAGRSVVFAPPTGVAVGPDVAWFDSSHAPVLGSGPLLRVGRVVHEGSRSYLADPFTGERLRDLAPSEVRLSAGADYVVDEYGYRTSSVPTISLTFDDGPDPTWTPRLLDLLSREHVPATFFLIGEEAIRYPALVHRIAAEGHAVGIHTWSHPHIEGLTDQQFRDELVLTDRVLHDESDVATRLVRLPYAGDDPGSRASELPAILRTQQLGYVVADYDVDTGDWATTDPNRIARPTLDGRDLTLLLHDGGGNRRATLAYVADLIDRAKAAGYVFQTMPQASRAIDHSVEKVPPSFADVLATRSASTLMTGPHTLMHVLFLVALLSVAVGGILMMVLAVVRHARRRGQVAGPVPRAGPLVTVLVPAYNEETVVAQTVASVTASRYRNLEVVVVDDGSTDRTAELVTSAAKRDSRVRLVRTTNRGKAAALNLGFRAAHGDVVVTIDADTLVEPQTVGAFVRPFLGRDGDNVGAVAGVIKVGNPYATFLTRWQALEYLSQIGLERAAQETLDAIMVVPGAGAAWRRSAVLTAGGFAEDTLAEDFDLSLTLQRTGWRIRQEDDAVCLTEAPHGFGALLRQRRRWTFGILQSLWKHRSMMLNPVHRWLGLVALPLTALSILVPVVFLPLVYATAIELVVHKGPLPLLGYLLAFTTVQAAVSVVAVRLLKESPNHLWVVPVYRLVYEPLRAYLLYASVLAALRGQRLHWTKLRRLGTVPVPETSALGHAADDASREEAA